MKLTTTHHLGQQPGRARLGAFDLVRRSTLSAGARGTWYAAGWPLCPSDPTVAAPNSLAKGDMGFGTGDGVKGTKAITHLSRHLGVRTT